MRKSLKRRRDISIAENDTQYKEIDTTKVFTNGWYTIQGDWHHKLFANGDSKEFDETIVDLMEKNRAQVKEIRTLKIEQESQAMMLCEVTGQKKRAIKDKAS